MARCEMGNQLAVDPTHHRATKALASGDGNWRGKSSKERGAEHGSAPTGASAHPRAPRTDRLSIGADPIAGAGRRHRRDPGLSASDSARGLHKRGDNPGLQRPCTGSSNPFRSSGESTNHRFRWRFRDIPAARGGPVRCLLIEATEALQLILHEERHNLGEVNCRLLAIGEAGHPPTLDLGPMACRQDS